MQLDVPSHLSAPSQAWLAHLTDGYEFTLSEWSLVVLAAETRDRAATARRALTREGLTVTTKGGEPRPHPCVIIARDCTALYSRLLHQLGLDEEDEEQVPAARVRRRSAA
jgi:phage terminase small subunit